PEHEVTPPADLPPEQSEKSKLHRGERKHLRDDFTQRWPACADERVRAFKITISKELPAQLGEDVAIVSREQQDQPAPAGRRGYQRPIDVTINVVLDALGILVMLQVSPPVVEE